MLLAALVIWLLDRYEREPVWAVTVAFCWGAFGAATGSIVFNEGIRWLLGRDQLAMQYVAVVTAPIVEEFFKGLIVVAFIPMRRLIDNTTDGIVYASISALGFAMSENFIYFVESGMRDGAAGYLATVLVRTGFTAPMHVVATSMLGGMIGYACWKGRTPAHLMLAVLIGYPTAVGTHIIWNGLHTLSQSTQSVGFSLVAFLLMAGTVIVYLLIGQLILHIEGRSLHRELKEEETFVGSIPEGHARILSSVFLRSGKTWLPAGINRGKYVRLAVRLALCKAHCRERHSERHEREIHSLRAEIRGLLPAALFGGDTLGRFSPELQP